MKAKSSIVDSPAQDKWASIRKHGHCSNYQKTPIYTSWACIIARCLNPRFRQYPDYGGRGIFVCCGLRTFDGFFTRMSPTWEHGLTIDRIDNNKNYTCGHCPQCLKEALQMNVKWSTRSEQNRNTRRNIWVEFRGDRLVLKDMAKKHNVPYYRLLHRIHRGWSIDEAILIPAGKRREH